MLQILVLSIIFLFSLIVINETSFGIFRVLIIFSTSFKNRYNFLLSNYESNKALILSKRPSKNISL